MLIICHYILIYNAEYIVRSSIVPIPEEELHSNFMKEQYYEFTKKTERKIDNARQSKYKISESDKIYYFEFGVD